MDPTVRAVLNGKLCQIYDFFLFVQDTARLGQYDPPRPFLCTRKIPRHIRRAVALIGQEFGLTLRERRESNAEHRTLCANVQGSHEPVLARRNSIVDRMLDNWTAY